MCAFFQKLTQAADVYEQKQEREETVEKYIKYFPGQPDMCWEAVEAWESFTQVISYRPEVLKKDLERVTIEGERSYVIYRVADNEDTFLEHEKSRDGFLRMLSDKLGDFLDEKPEIGKNLVYELKVCRHVLCDICSRYCYDHGIQEDKYEDHCENCPEYHTVTYMLKW